jgi:hypothetical protein
MLQSTAHVTDKQDFDYEMKKLRACLSIIEAGYVRLKEKHPQDIPEIAEAKQILDAMVKEEIELEEWSAAHGWK